MNLFVRDWMRKVSPMYLCLRCSRLRIVIRVLLDLRFESNDDDAFYLASRRVLLTCTESAELTAVALSSPS